MRLGDHPAVKVLASICPSWVGYPVLLAPLEQVAEMPQHCTSGLARMRIAME